MIPAFLMTKAFGYSIFAALVIGYSGAVFYAGSQYARSGHEKALRLAYEERDRVRAEAEEKALEIEREGRRAIEGITHVRIPLESDCRLDEPSRVRFNEAVAEFNKYGSAVVPD